MEAKRVAAAAAFIASPSFRDLGGDRCASRYESPDKCAATAFMASPSFRDLGGNRCASRCELPNKSAAAAFMASPSFRHLGGDRCASRCESPNKSAAAAFMASPSFRDLGGDRCASRCESPNKSAAAAFMASPSFRDLGGDRCASRCEPPNKSAAAAFMASPSLRDLGDDWCASRCELPYKSAAADDDGFEFTAVLRNSAGGRDQLISADEIFSGGLIRPLYRSEGGNPKDQEEIGSESSRHSAPMSSTEVDVVGDPMLGPYCQWSPGLGKTSTGSLTLRRIKDLVTGRSKSDGKEKLVFIDAAEKRKGKNKIKSTKVAPLPRRSSASVDFGNGTEEEEQKGMDSKVAKRGSLLSLQIVAGFLGNRNGKRTGRRRHSSS